MISRKKKIKYISFGVGALLVIWGILGVSRIVPFPARCHYVASDVGGHYSLFNPLFWITPKSQGGVWWYTWGNCDKDPRFNFNVFLVDPIFKKEVHLIYAADFSKDTILLGASHNVFIGKVVGQTGTKSRGEIPETQFEVSILDNIKGELQGSVTVNQEGGYRDGVLYVMRGGDASLPHDSETGSYFLQPGSTYLFATRFNEQEDWHTLNSHNNASKLISANSALTNSQLQALAENDQMVERLQAAYPNEILLKADVDQDNVSNSYQSLSESEKAALPYYVTPAPAATSTFASEN